MFILFSNEKHYNYSVFLLLISVFFFITAINSANAACPVGFTSFTDTINIDGCEIEFDVCYNCGTGPVPGSVTLMEVRVLDSCQMSLNYYETVNYINNYISTYQYLYSNFCLDWGSNVPPCDGYHYKTIKVNLWYCWNIEKILYFGKTIMKYSPCNYDSWCELTKYICWDPINRKFIEEESYTPFGTPNCFLEPHQVFPPNNYNEPTPCYRVPTGCDQ